MPGSPVDRGWAWMVLTGSVIAGCINSVGYVVGLFNIVFLEVFKKDKFTTSWIGSLASSMVMLTGPCATLLCNKIGARYTVALGAGISASGFILTSFARTITQVFITYGFVTGFGIGLTTVPCILAIGNHFEKYRNLAFGIYSSSIGLGSIIFPPLVSMCIEHYGWRGATLIMGGCCLHFLIHATCLRPAEEITDNKMNDEVLPGLEVVEADDKLRHDSGHHSMGDTDSVHNAKLPIVLVDQTTMKARNNPLELLPIQNRSAHSPRIATSPIGFNRSLFGMDFLTQSSVAIGSIGNFQHIFKRTKRHETSEGRGELPAERHPLDNSVRPIKVRKHLSVNDINLLRRGQISVCSESISLSHGTLPQCMKKPRAQTDCSSSNYVLRFSPVFQKKQHSYLETSDLELDVPDHRTYEFECGWEGSQTDSQLFEVATDNNLFESMTFGTIIKSVDNTEMATSEREYSLLNPGLIGLAASQFLFCIAMSITYLHLPAYAISNGTSDMQAASLISVIGICNVIVRFLVGAVTANESVDDTIVYIVSSFLAGIFLSLAEVLCSTFTTQLLFAGLFGFFANGFVSIMGPLSIRYVGLDLLGAAYSTQLVVSGVGFFIGPPLAGLVFDLTGSYANSFYIAGISYIIGALIMVPVFIWERMKKR